MRGTLLRRRWEASLFCTSLFCTAYAANIFLFGENFLSCDDNLDENQPHNRSVETKTKKMELFGLRGLLENRWTVLVAGIWIECCAGASYSFSIYSHTIKTRFGYNQKQLETISVFKDLGQCLGIISGILYDRFPPWVVLLVGCVQNFIGYIFIWLFLTQRLPMPALWELCVFICLAINSQSHYNTASLVTCVNNFPANRGIVVGLMKGCLGLSSAILSRFWHVIPTAQRRDGSSFLLVAAWVPSAIAFLLIPFVRKYPLDRRVDQIQYIGLAYSKEEADFSNVDLAELTRADNSSKDSTTVKLLFTSGPIVVLAIFLMGCAFWKQDNSLLNRVECMVEILILASPLWIAWKLTASYKSRISFTSSSIDEPLIIDGSQEQCKEDGRRCPSKNPNGRDDNSFAGALCSLNFGLVLFTSAIALGSGFVAVNNISQVATALAYSEDDVTIFVSLMSISQFIGRFGGGVFSDYLLHRFRIARPLLTAIAEFILSCGYIVIASAFPGSLHLGSIVIGLSVGANWCLNPTTVSELFGLRHFGTLYNVVLVGSPVLSYVLSVWVAGYLYDREAEKQGMQGQCRGNTCFNLTFLILSGACMLAALSSFLLWIRTRSFYKTIRS